MQNSLFFLLFQAPGISNCLSFRHTIHALDSDFGVTVHVLQI